MNDADKALATKCGLAGSLSLLEKNLPLFEQLKGVLERIGVASSGCDNKLGNMILYVVTNLTGDRVARRDFLLPFIVQGRLATQPQVAAAVTYLKSKASDAPIDEADFAATAGVDVKITDDEITKQVNDVIASHREDLLSQRYLHPDLMREVKSGRFAWADGGKVKSTLDAAILALLGPKTDDDAKRAAEAMAAKKAAGKSKDSAAADSKATAAKTSAAASAADTGKSAKDASVGVFEGRDLKAAYNKPEHIAEHLKVTGGVLRTRFPPEPNGYLHVGHAKSMNLNFEGAFLALGKKPGVEGVTFFRYDDTNPEKENDIYIRSQADNVEWLGWKPFRTTHSSDYFPQLYDFAVQLIKKDKAFVCHQTKEEMEACRDIARARDGRDPNSPWRNRPIEESLREFEAMRYGKYEEGKATLRLKIDMHHVNPTMWDPVAYRIKYTPHPVSGDAWCIYPAYDYSHCIIDSLEHIDYSLCTLEFEVRRDIYYWVLEQLDIYRPYVWEFSRLNITHFMLSKRKILKLVEDEKVRGWDDPRLATINGLRRRGYRPEAINAFCRDIGVTRNENMIQIARLEHFIREDLDVHAPRAFAVLRPLKVVLVNFPASEVHWYDAPNFPRNPALGSHKISITNVVYIEQNDFREVDSSDYYGLAPGKVAGLRYGGYVKVLDFVKDASGNVVELRCEYDEARSWPGKVKGNLHWVSASTPGAEPTTAEVRLYDNLFNTEEPGSTGDWESEINPDSEVVLKSCYVDASLSKGLALRNHFQFERIGFFVVDQDSDFEACKYVFNLTVSLKEDATAKKLRA